MPRYGRMLASVHVSQEDQRLRRHRRSCTDKGNRCRRGVPEAQIIREGIHLAAMSNRVWDGSLDWPTFEGTGEPATSAEVTEAVARAAAGR